MNKNCKCGCGQEIKIKSHHKYYGIPIYINGHAFKYKKHSKETKEVMSQKAKGKIFTKKHRENLSISHKGQGLGKKRPDQSERMLGRKNPNYNRPPKPRWGMYKNINMRSNWEILYAKYLDRNNITWEYESNTFDLGDTAYTPDFKLSDNVYVEIKGYMSEKAYLKIKKFLMQYPDIKLQILMQKDLQKLGIL